MKTILLLLAIIFTISDPVLIPSAIQVNPKEINALTKDTVTQLTWRAFDVVRDTTQGCNTYVQLYDNKGKQVWATNIPIPAEVVRQWGTNDTIIDNFILQRLNLVKKP